jgi:polyhydroxyalkanoate synthesis regulator protein
MMEQAMKMFTPDKADPRPDGEAKPEEGNRLDEFQSKIDALQKQLEELGKGRRGPA